MKTILTLAALSTILLTSAARAETCIDFKSCSKLMFDLKGQRYIWDAKMDENKFIATPDVEMNKDNAELMYTALLDHFGLARLPVGDNKTYRVVKSVMLKEIEAPVVEASADHPPAFPSNTWDWVTMRYRLKSPEEAFALEAAYRLHLPREARMQADDNVGLLIITGTTPVVRQMYETIKAADRPLTALARKHYDEYRAHMFAPPPPQAAVLPVPPPGAKKHP